MAACPRTSTWTRGASCARRRPAGAARPSPTTCSSARTARAARSGSCSRRARACLPVWLPGRHRHSENVQVAQPQRGIQVQQPAPSAWSGQGLLVHVCCDRTGLQRDAGHPGRAGEHASTQALLQVAHARLVLLRARGLRDEGPRRLGAPACAGRPAGGLPRSRRPAPAARAAHGQRAPSSPHVLASTLQHAREVDLRQVQTHATTLSTALGEAQLLPARGPGRVFARACARRSCSSSAAAAVATTCALSRLNCAASRATSPTPPPAGRHT